MSTGSIRANGIIGEVDPTEVITTDDLATRHADEFLAIALFEHHSGAQQQLPGKPGTCRWCEQACIASAVYCDADCRDDHERHLAARRRQGSGAA